MNSFLGELLGTMLLVLFGDGVVANVVLSRSKGQNSGWIVIAAGWAAGVMIAVYAVNALSGAHLNPAVTIALATIGKFEWARVPGYVLAQTIGAFLGGVLVWLTYLPHWSLTEDKGLKLAVFSTGPAVRQPLANLVSEAIATAATAVAAAKVGTIRPFAAVSGPGSAADCCQTGGQTLSFTQIIRSARFHRTGERNPAARVRANDSRGGRPAVPAGVRPPPWPRGRRHAPVG